MSESKDEIRKAVREQYGRVAQEGSGCGCGTGCCGGLGEIRIGVDERSRAFIRDWVPGSGAERYVASASIEAVKPAGAVSGAAPSRA